MNAAFQRVLVDCQWGFGGLRACPEGTASAAFREPGKCFRDNERTRLGVRFPEVVLGHSRLDGLLGRCDGRFAWQREPNGMGQMRFLAPRGDRVPDGALAGAYLAGMEGIPWRSKCSWVAGASCGAEGGEIVIERAVNESGNLYILWRVEGHGELVLSTASLRERREPYNLPVELARGVLNRLRGQAAEWETLGMAWTQRFKAELKAASALFVQAVTLAADEAQAAERAEQSLAASLAAIETLVTEYIGLALAARRQQAEPLQAMLAVRLGSGPLPDTQSRLLLTALNSAVIPFTWRSIEETAGKYDWELYDQQIQWCRDHGLTVLGGPLLELDERRIPDWLYLWEDDFDQLRAYLVHYIRTTVQRYQGKVHVWNCAARMNSQSALSLTEEQKLRLVVGAIDEVRRADSRTPIIISFDQPWAEYLATNDLELSPLHFADSLLRADLGVAGIGLQLDIDYWPGGTIQRDLLEYSRQLDRWSLLGVPLLVYLTAPSSSEPDPGARFSVKPPRGTSGAEFSPATQRSLIQRLAPLLLAKQQVRGLVWNQLSDGDPHEFAHAGLFDAQQRPKPALDALVSIRQQYLT